MDDVTKKESIMKTKNTSLPLSRHTMNKFIFNFLNQWNINFSLNASFPFR